MKQVRSRGRLCLGDRGRFFPRRSSCRWSGANRPMVIELRLKPLPDGVKKLRIENAADGSHCDRHHLGGRPRGAAAAR